MKHLFLNSLFLLLSTLAVAQVEDSASVVNEIDSTGTFEKIKVPKLPDYIVVREALMQSGLFKICEDQGFDQLERDLLFMYTASYPFNEYKNKLFIDDSGREYIDVFPEERLRVFWRKAREVLKEKASNSNGNKQHCETKCTSCYGEGKVKKSKLEDNYIKCTAYRCQNGTRYFPSIGKSEDCEWCKGHGEINDANWVYFDVDCSKCGGDGCIDQFFFIRIINSLIMVFVNYV